MLPVLSPQRRSSWNHLACDTELNAAFDLFSAAYPWSDR